MASFPSNENDTLTGTAGNDTIDGLAGNDTIDGLAGNDRLSGGDGDNVLNGGTGADTLFGGAGNDMIVGGSDRDRMYPGPGNDTVDGTDSARDDVRYFDTHYATTKGIVANLATGLIQDPWGGTDTVHNVPRVFGTMFTDHFIGDAQSNVFIAFGGADTIEGGDGWDRVGYWETASPPVVVDLEARTATVGGATQTLISIEGASGSLQNDSIYGTAGDDYSLYGEMGDDLIDGRGGMDTASYDLDSAKFSIRRLADGAVEVRQIVPSADGWNLGTDRLVDIEILEFLDQKIVLAGLAAPTSGDDVLTGTAGNDVIGAGAGNDTVAGGAGVDTVVLSGHAGQYRLTVSGKTLTVSGPDGTDTLTGVETLRFDQGTIDVSSLTGTPDPNAIYRFYNTQTGTHFYTNAVTERDAVLNNLASFQFEGTAFASTGNAGHSVWRFYNTQTGTHFYTIDDAERDAIQSGLPQFQFEGEAYKAGTDSGAGLDPLYRFFNEQTGAHFFTASQTERDTVANTLPQFKYEGIAYYVDLA